MDINGKHFKECQYYSVIGQKVVRLGMNDRYGYDTIEEAYKSPSSTKRHIWSDWVSWLYSIEGAVITNYYIPSRNSHIFTIAFRFKKDGYEYYGYITPCHNYIVRTGVL